MRSTLICYAVTFAVLGLAGCHSTRPIENREDVAKSSGWRGYFVGREGYTCCNLRHEGDWISDTNYANLPMIPAGTPARTLDPGDSFVAPITLDSRPMRLAFRNPGEGMTMKRYLEKIIVRENPQERMKSYSPEVRAAIGYGMVMKGMTKEQVVMSLGYPIGSENPRLDGPV